MNADVRPRWIAPSTAAPVQPGRAPTFSIVIPAFQAAATVGAAIDSALAQSYPAQEIIVVDDGSTDALDRALAPYAGRVTLLRKRNGGGASALNTALETLATDFLAVLDSDDAYAPRRLEALADLATHRPDLDLISTDAELVVDGRVVGSLHDATPFAAADQREEILKRCFPGACPAVRVSRVRALGGWDESIRVAYDWDCWIRVLLDGSLAGFVDEPLYRYTLAAGTLTANRIQSLWDRVRVLEKARGNASLRAFERGMLERSLRYHRTRAIVAEAAVRLEAADRRWFAAHAARRGVEWRTRLALAVAAAAPRLATTVLPADPGSLAGRYVHSGS